MNFAYFFVVVAWIFAPLYTVWTGAVIYWSMVYPGSLEELGDRLKGVRRTFNAGKPFIVAIVCWAYILTYYFG